MIKQAMLMAAGLGTRLQPFTSKFPKALMPLMGVPMAQFAIDALGRADVTEIVANIHGHPEASRAGLLALERGNSRLIISDESAALLGSAGGIRQVLEHFGAEPFFLVNADVLHDLNLRDLGDYHQAMRRKFDVLVTLAVIPGGAGSYREIDFDPVTGMINRLGDIVPGKPFFMGAAVLEPEALAQVPKGPSEFVPQILEPAVRAGRACAYFANCFWRDVGTPRLWYDTHFSLLDGVETGSLSASLRFRIEKGNRRIAERIWVDRAFAGIDHSRWVGPSYFGLGSGKREIPEVLGPRAVLYDSLPQATGPGIGAFGEWLPMEGV